MAAMVILYIGFSLYNNIVWKRLLRRSGKPGKLREFHFAKFVSTLTTLAPPSPSDQLLQFTFTS